MNYIKISSILEYGVSNKERIVFKAVGIDDVGKYIAFHTNETSPGQISSKPKNVYWFPDQQVKAGDYIFLYTGVGINTSFVNNFGTMTYVFYWGLPLTLFNAPQDSIALLRIESWEYKSRD